MTHNVSLKKLKGPAQLLEGLGKQPMEERRSAKTEVSTATGDTAQAVGMNQSSYLGKVPLENVSTWKGSKEPPWHSKEQFSLKTSANRNPTGHETAFPRLCPFPLLKDQRQHRKSEEETKGNIMNK